MSINNLTQKGILYRDISSKDIIVLFLISPILSLPWIIKKSYKGNKTGYILLSILIGLLSTLAWPPRADTYRHYMTFFEIQNKSIDYVYDYYFRFDFILLGLQYLFGKLGLYFELIRFTFIFITYSLYLNLYSIFIEKMKPSNSLRRMLFLAIIFSVPFINITYSLRYAFAISIICYVIIKMGIDSKCSKLDYFLLIISPMIHFASVWLIAILLISKLLPNRVPKLVIISIFLLLILLSFLSADIISIITPDFLGERIVFMYTEGGASENHLAGRNIFGNLGDYISILFILFCICTSIFILPYNSKTKIFYLIIMLWLFTLPLFEINRRVGIPVCIVGGIYYIIYSQCSKYIKKFIIKFLIITSLMTTVVNWRMYTISNVYYIIAPFPIALAQSYDKQWISDNVTSDGTLRIYQR